MGVYVFQTAGAWVKVGHYLAKPSRPNAYYRIAGRGFQSCVHPAELEHRLGVDDLRLVAWYPSLDRDAEKRLHAASAGRIGEFHPQCELEGILAACDALAPRRAVTEPQRLKALAWGWRKVRKAQRKRRRANG